MTQREQGRLQVLNSLLAEHMTLDQAATLMGVSPRHTRRILAAYQEKGAATVAHGLRGRKPANATPEPVATAVIHLAHTRYAGTNHTHLSELLSERDGIDIGRTTLRRILVNAGLSSPRRRRPPKHRVRRQRMPRVGMLIQMDGSHHLGVSPRHTRRILAAYQEKGAATVAHGLRGRKPANATPEPVATAVIHLAHTRYAGTNHTHLSELLSERDGIDIGRTTLRRILVNAGLSSPRRRRPPKHRVRRQRMPRVGMLIQMDGSHHPWLGDRLPPFTLLIAVDDATGTVVDALFCKKEDAHSYFLLIQRLLQRRGVPLALYTDRHGVFRHTPGSGLPGMPTQFSRAMDELGIQMIFALSPQAKGRVERMAETFQDRLVTELRLAGASSIEEANSVLEQFLPRFNRRFRVPPQYSEPAFRPLDPELCLEQLLCFKHRRKVAKDNTVRFQLHTLQ